MKPLELTETQLTNMAEQAVILAKLLEIIRWIKFDSCYSSEDVEVDLWNIIVECSIMDFSNRLSS